MVEKVKVWCKYVNLRALHQIFKQNGVYKKPIFYILIFSFFFHILGLLWGMPDNKQIIPDTLAPRQPIIALGKGFSFGWERKYGLVHHLILGILSIPVLLAAAIQSLFYDSYSWSQAFLLINQTVPYETALTIIYRLVTIFMTVGLVYLVYKSGEELFDKTAGLFAAGITTLTPFIARYSAVAKVDIPFVFWALLSLYFLIKALKYNKRKFYIYTAIFSMVSFCTKDPGYAIFILPFIFYLSIYRAFFNRDKNQSWYKAVFNNNFWAFAIAFIVSFIAFNNLILNLSGFIHRWFMLTGELGTRSIRYTLNFNGIIALLVDSVKSIYNIRSMGLPVFIISLISVPILYYEYIKEKKDFILNNIFFVASLSSYIFFVQIIRQDDPRFFLPVYIFLSIYAGYFLSFIYQRTKNNKFFKKIFIAFVFLLGLHNFYISGFIKMEYIYDDREPVKEWMQKNISKGSVIEHYSGTYPKFPDGTIHYRIWDNKKLSPYPIKEIEKRKPDYIFLKGYYRRYLVPKKLIIKDGRYNVRWKYRRFAIKTDFPEFFKKLFNNELNYRLIKTFKTEKFPISIPFLIQRNIREVKIYKRIQEGEK